MLEVRTDPDGRYVIIHASVYDKNMVLVGLYLPPLASVLILNDIMQVFLSYDTSAIFLMGDFNIVPYPNLDRLRGVSRVTSALTQWASSSALVDV